MSKKGKNIYDWKKIQEYYDQGYSIRQAIEYFNIGSMRTFQKASLRGDFVSRKPSENETPNEKIFIQNSLSSRGIVRRRIIRDDLLPYECAECSNKGLWLGEEIALELHHKNGINNDHRLENLEFLCPNCHSQTDTWACGGKDE